MPAANCRTSPARSISLWLSASASAGSSLRVGTRDLLRRIRLVSVRRLVRALHARLVAQPLDRLAVDDVALEDLLEVRRLHARVPDVVGIDHEHRAVAALREAAGLVDADLVLESRLERLAAQVLHELLDVALARARLSAGANEHVCAVLAHGLLRHRRLSRLALGQELVHFLAHGADDLGLGDLAHDLPVLEDQTDPAPPGHADVGGARLARTVDLASHHRDVDLFVEAFELVLHLAGELHQIDVGATARGARDEGEAALAKPERLQDVDADAHLFHRIGRERHADGVADALGQERAQADGGLDRPHTRCPRLGHAEVEGILDLVGERAVRLDHHERIGRFERDLHLRIAALLEDADVAEGRLHHAGRRRPAVLLEQVLLQRAAVDADADGNLALLGEVDDLLHEALAPDVAGIQSEPVHPLLEGDQGELVVEVDVGDERDADLALDLAELLGGLANGHRATHDLAAGRFQRPDLQERRLDVARVGLRHRLYGDGGVAAHLELAQLDRSRLAPCDHGLVRGRPI